MWKLVIEDGDGHETVVSLSRERYSIGRGEESNLRLTEQNISRRHAHLTRAGESFVLEDLGSYNGTYLNAERVTAASQLAHGDLVQLGDYCLLLEEAAEE